MDSVLFGSESISHYSKSNIIIWMTLAFQAGALNMGGFMACHQFVSHVTGFATHFGYQLDQGRVLTALGILAVPIFFLLGSALSGYLIDIRLKLSQKPRYYIVFGIIFFLILSICLGGVAGIFGIFGEPLELSRDYFLLILLCLTCGIQNGTVTMVSKSVVRTTHLTGITTDLGLGLVRVLNRRQLDTNISNERRANWMRAGIIVFFVFGSVLGGVAHGRYGYAGFFLPVVTSGGLFLVMFYFQVMKSVLPTSHR